MAVQVPSWSSLRWLGQSRLLRSSFFWIIFVPIAAKALSATGSPVLNPIPGTNLSLALELPFSWNLFFFGALFTAAANLVFLIACPPIIRDYITYADFAGQGKGASSLLIAFETLVQKHHASLTKSELKGNVSQFWKAYSNTAFQQTTLDEIDTDSLSAITILAKLNRLKPNSTSVR